MIEKVRIGIAGTGFMGQAHATCFKLMPDVEIVMVTSRTEEQARTFAEKNNIPYWTSDWKELVHSSKLDAIDIVLPNSLHKEVALACIDQKRPFLLEKPMARTLSEAVEIYKAIQENQVLAMYGENLRYSSLFLEAKSIVERGGIGQPILIRVNEMHNGPSHSDWFWDATLCGGGVAIDMGIHGIYIMEWIMGSMIQETISMTEVLKWKKLCQNGAEDTAISVMKFETGALGELTNSWVVSGGIDVRVEIFGTEGSIYIDESKAGALRMYSASGLGIPIEVQEKQRPHPESNIGWSFPKADEWGLSGHKNEIRHFIDCVKYGLEPQSSLREGLSALAVIEAIYRSAATGMRVQVKRK